MKLYARRSSSNSQKILWFLGELQLEYEFFDTGGTAGSLMYRYVHLDVTRDPPKHVAAWYERLTEREALSGPHHAPL